MSVYLAVGPCGTIRDQGMSTSGETCSDRVRFLSQSCDCDVAPQVPSATVAPSKPGKHMESTWKARASRIKQVKRLMSDRVQSFHEFSRSGDTNIVCDPAARSTVAAHGVLDMSKAPRVEEIMICHDIMKCGLNTLNMSKCRKVG